MQILPLDLQFQNCAQSIAAYLISYQEGALLIESGPGSTVPRLTAELNRHGLDPEQVTDVLVTHIHLDHAGAAGWLAARGARVHVHPIGAPHLIDPQRLLASAARIYGDQMDALWGDFLPVPQRQVVVHEDGDRFRIGEIEILAVDTPGHASHHLAYLVGETCFCGDIGGVRLPESTYVRLPTPPPEFAPALWRQSVARIRGLAPTRLALTHFGIHDAGDHFQRLETTLDAFDEWMNAAMAAEPDRETLRESLARWERSQAEQSGVKEARQAVLETVNPAWTSADGVYRYWTKAREG